MKYISDNGLEVSTDPNAILKYEAELDITNNTISMLKEIFLKEEHSNVDSHEIAQIILNSRGDILRILNGYISGTKKTYIKKSVYGKVTEEKIELIKSYKDSDPYAPANKIKEDLELDISAGTIRTIIRKLKDV